MATPRSHCPRGDSCARAVRICDFLPVSHSVLAATPGPEIGDGADVVHLGQLDTGAWRGQRARWSTFTARAHACSCNTWLARSSRQAVWPDAPPVQASAASSSALRGSRFAWILVTVHGVESGSRPHVGDRQADRAVI